jgi:hypothetical protein
VIKSTEYYMKVKQDKIYKNSMDYRNNERLGLGLGSELGLGLVLVLYVLVSYVVYLYLTLTLTLILRIEMMEMKMKKESCLTARKILNFLQKMNFNLLRAIHQASFLSFSDIAVTITAPSKKYVLPNCIQSFSGHMKGDLYQPV